MAIYKTLRSGSDEEELKKQSASTGSYGYDPAKNEAFNKALEQLKQTQAQTPTYKGTYDQQVKDMYDKIANREKFSYDLNGDALYNQYKNQATQKGKLAMMDTMGQAAALTGGYGNSYAQNVGQQAYQAQLQQLNEVIPELYGMALDQYNREGDRMLQQHGMLSDMANTEYGRYQDAMAQHRQDLAFQKQLADDAYNRGFDNWYAEYQNRYQAERDQVADQRWQQEFDEALRQHNEQMQYQQNRDQVADQRYQQEFEYQQGRDQIADDRYAAELEYQQGRDQAADDRWKKEFDEALRQFNAQMDYQAGRDKVLDERYGKEFEYQEGRDKVMDERYDKEFQYQQDRDKVSDQQWQDAFNYQTGRDEAADKQWQAEFDEAKRQYDEQFAFNKEKYADSNGSGGGGGVTSAPYEYNAKYGVYSEETAELQRRLNELGANLEVDGIRGDLTNAAYEKYKHLLNGSKESATTSDPEMGDAGKTGTGFAENSTVMRQVNAYVSAGNINKAVSTISSVYAGGREAEALNMIDEIYPKLNAEQKKEVDRYLSSIGYTYET